MFSYSSIYKPVKSVLSGHSSDSHSLSVKTNPNNDLNIGIDASKSTKDNSITSSLDWSEKFKNGDTSYSITGSLDEEGTVTMGTTVLGLAKGLETNFSGSFKTNNSDNKVTSNLVYTHEKVNVGGKFNYGIGKDLTVTASTVGKVAEGLAVGAECQLQAYPVPSDAKKTLKEYNLGARYSMNNFHIAALLENSMKNVKIGYAHNVDSNVTVAGEFAHDLQSGSGDKTAPTFTLGCDYKIDNESSVRAKANTKGTINATYNLSINPRLSTAVSVEADALDLSSGTSNVGFSVEYGA